MIKELHNDYKYKLEEMDIQCKKEFSELRKESRKAYLISIGSVCLSVLITISICIKNSLHKA